LGTRSDEALQAALQSFGNLQQVGRKIAQEKTATVRSRQRLAWSVRVLSGLIGGWVGLSLVSIFSFLMDLNTGSRGLHQSGLLPLFLCLLGGRAGWVLASGKGTVVGGPLAGLVGSQIGMGLAVALSAFSHYHGWWMVTYYLSSLALCLHAMLGAVVGWSLWKRPKSLLGSISLGSVVFGLPNLLIGLVSLYRCPDYRTSYIETIFTLALLVSCGAGGITGAAMGLCSRLRKYSDKTGYLPFFRRKANTGGDLLAG
jgi:hypothetical protein